MELKIKKLEQDAKTPIRAHETDAGIDFFSLETKKIKPQSRESFKTGIALKLPSNTYLSLRDRSGLAIKHGIKVLGGVIDESYTGEIIVILLNTSKEEYEVKKGDKIVQGIIQRYETPKIKIVEELEKTIRSNKGFGSTGK